MNSQVSPEQTIREAAAEWAVHLHAGDLDADRQAELQRWLDTDARHRTALALAEKTWAAMGDLSIDPPRAGTPPPQRFTPRREAPVARPQRRRSRVRLAASIALVLLVTGVGMVRGPDWVLRTQADYLTVKGEIRTVQLSDGSSVELDSGSAIRVEYTGQERRIRLLAGSACFDVAPMGDSEVRPFVVESAVGETRALGTRFVVGRESADAAWVGVLQHSVAVSLYQTPQQGQGERVLQEGHSARYSTGGGVEPLEGLDLQRATSWRRGILVFERQPLAQVIEQLNRYRSGQVLLANNALAQRQVSGVFRLDMLDSAVPALTRELKINHVDLAGVSFIY